MQMPAFQRALAAALAGKTRQKRTREEGWEQCTGSCTGGRNRPSAPPNSTCRGICRGLPESNPLPSSGTGISPSFSRLDFWSERSSSRSWALHQGIGGGGVRKGRGRTKYGTAEPTAIGAHLGGWASFTMRRRSLPLELGFEVWILFFNERVGEGRALMAGALSEEAPPIAAAGGDRSQAP